MLLHSLVAEVLVVRLLDNLAGLTVRRGKDILDWYVVLRLYLHLVLVLLLLLVAHDEVCEWVLLFLRSLLLSLLGVGAIIHKFTRQLLMFSLWHHVQLTGERTARSSRTDRALGLIQSYWPQALIRRTALNKRLALW